VQKIQKGDIQARICLATISGYFVNTVITIDSLERLGLQKGSMAAAEVKAPWVILQKSEVEPVCSAENRFSGIVSRITRGAINTEYVVRIPDGTFLCAIVSETGDHHLNLCEGDPVWAFFSSFAVVLHVD
jgi:molybdate transport system regulatory protein